MRSIRIAFGLSAAAALSLAGCGGSSFSSAGGGSGGEPSAAGKSSGGSSASGNGSGGSADSAGAETGGSVTTAGTSSGGTDGGSAGQTMMGGSAGQTGGGTGGTSSGGTGVGGRPSSCRQDSDCVACAYPTAPRSVQDCYCATCNSTPMTKVACDANRSDFDKVCGNVPMICPAIACVRPPDPVCDQNMCVAGTTR